MLRETDTYSGREHRGCLCALTSTTHSEFTDNRTISPLTDKVCLWPNSWEIKGSNLWDGRAQFPVGGAANVSSYLHETPEVSQKGSRGGVTIVIIDPLCISKLPFAGKWRTLHGVKPCTQRWPMVCQDPSTKSGATAAHRDTFLHLIAIS